MDKFNFLNTFRGKLLVVLAVLLIVTLGGQYYLNLQTERENADRRRRQEKVLVAGIALGVSSLSSAERLINLKDKQPFSAELTERVSDILIINDRWEVYDSLNPNLVPKENGKDEFVFQKIDQLNDLPPLLNPDLVSFDRDKFPNARPLAAGQTAVVQNVDRGESHAIPIETDKGRWYVMVILKPEEGEAFRRAALPLVYTLIVLLASTLVTFFLVWRFTRPIKNLSEAASLIAHGDLSVRVEGARWLDEMGRLTTRFNEMTEQLEKSRELETQLQQAEKSAVIGRLGSAIAHEIRNPLNYINLTLDHLRAKFAPDNPDKRETFDKLTAQLKSEVARINQQVTDFLRYSRPIKLNLQPTDVRVVIEDSLRIIEGQAIEQNIETIINEQQEIPLVLGDAEFLRSVFNNLFVNAVQAMPDGGKLIVAISQTGKSIEIKVSDTGDGIAPENIDKVFEPYFSTKETGTGLGLAIVKRIIDDHEGTITVNSEINKGAVFTVKLPIA